MQATSGISPGWLRQMATASSNVFPSPAVPPTLNIPKHLLLFTGNRNKVILKSDETEDERPTTQEHDINRIYTSKIQQINIWTNSRTSRINIPPQFCLSQHFISTHDQSFVNSLVKLSPFAQSLVQLTQKIFSLEIHPWRTPWWRHWPTLKNPVGQNPWTATVVGFVFSVLTKSTGLLQTNPRGESQCAFFQSPKIKPNIK